MSRHDDQVSLRQMMDHVAEAQALVQNHHRGDLDNNRMLLLALLKLAEIVGEAANRVSPCTRDAHPEIPWKQIIGTRHRLVHGYDTVDHDLVWDIVTVDFPALLPQLQALLQPK